MNIQTFQQWGFPLLLIVVMYFTIFMPQRKREKKVNQMINSLKEGNEIITVGGIVGKIVNIRDNELTIETSVEKTQLKVMKWSVKEVV